MTANHNTEYTKVQNKTIKTIARAGGGKSTYLRDIGQTYEKQDMETQIISFTRSGAGRQGSTLHSILSKILHSGYYNQSLGIKEHGKIRNIMDTDQYNQFCLRYSDISPNDVLKDQRKKDYIHIRHGMMSSAIHVWNWIRSVYHVRVYTHEGKIEKNVNLDILYQAYQDYVVRFGTPEYNNLFLKSDTTKNTDGKLVQTTKVRKKRTPIQMRYPMFVHCIGEYEKWKRAMQYDDYTDILMYPLMREGTDMCPRVDVLLIDEAQDCAPIHWEILWKFATHDRIQKVYLVGDDSQCLYNFTGAQPYDFQRFPCSNNTNSQSVILPRIYRYGSEIWKNAYQFLEKTNTPYDSSHVQPVGKAGQVLDVYGQKGMIDILHKIPKEKRDNSVIITATNAQKKDIFNLIDNEIYHLDPASIYDEYRFPIQTYHAVKGGTYRNALTVFSAPKKWIERSRDYTEFARMLYVGTTRAQNVQINAHNVFPRQVDMDTII
jgi:hypothetical protein